MYVYVCVRVCLREVITTGPEIKVIYENAPFFVRKHRGTFAK